jgi:hypothetical protein
MDRDDFEAAEAMLDGSPLADSLVAPDGNSTALARLGIRGQPLPQGPVCIAPTVARGFARLLDRAADLAELQGAVGQPLLSEPGANDVDPSTVT